MARPTDYKEEYINMVEDYLAENEDAGAGLKLEVKLPTIEGFAVYIGVVKSTLYEWAKKNPEFSNALARLKTEQYKRLLNSGLSGKYNSVITKLILSSNHGLSEKQIVENQVNLTVDTKQKEEIDDLIDEN